jgi:orotate phosphoribosyltransferase
LERLAVEYLGPSDPIGRVQDLAWLRKIIVERALTRGDYVLSGGARSDYYIDKFRLFSDPHVLRRIARLFVPLLAEVNPDLVAGTELGGVVIATAVSQMSGIPLLAVRKEPKGYGAFPGEYVEGPYEAGQHVLLLEDVVTTGRDLLGAKARLEELNLRVTCCAVISRGLAPVRSLIQFSLPRGAAKTEN